MIWWLGLGIYHKIYFYKPMKEENKTIKYKGKCIKMSEETWKKLKDKRKKSHLSWNLYLLELLSKK